MTETARMYGGSLYDLAAEEGLDERILGELDGVTALLNGDAEYLHLLSIPSIPKKERCALLDEAFRGQVHLYVLNFMKLLCEKGALRELPGCARAYRLRYNEAHGILEATAVSAVPLTRFSLESSMIRLPCFAPLRDGDRFFGCVRASCFAHLLDHVCGCLCSVPAVVRVVAEPIRVYANKTIGGCWSVFVR